jgi:hypothetical protein
MGLQHLYLPHAQEVLVLPHGRTFVQQTPGSRREADPRRVGGRPPTLDVAVASSTIGEEENPFLNHDFDTFFDDVYTIAQPVVSGALARSKKARQYQRWKFDVIPSLVDPYHTLMQETSNLRREPQSFGQGRCGCDRKRTLTVECVYYDREYTNLILLNYILNFGIACRFDCESFGRL